MANKENVIYKKNILKIGLGIGIPQGSIVDPLVSSFVLYSEFGLSLTIIMLFHKAKFSNSKIICVATSSAV